MSFHFSYCLSISIGSESICLSTRLCSSIRHIHSIVYIFFDMSNSFFPGASLRVWPVTNLKTTQRYLGRISDIEELRLIGRRREGFLLKSYEPRSGRDSLSNTGNLRWDLIAGIPGQSWCVIPEPSEKFHSTKTRDSPSTGLHSTGISPRQGVRAPKTASRFPPSRPQTDSQPSFLAYRPRFHFLTSPILKYHFKKRTVVGLRPLGGFGALHWAMAGRKAGAQRTA